jgi:hypothetical protein
LELFEARKSESFLEDGKILLLESVEDFPVNGLHDAGGEEGFEVHLRRDGCGEACARAGGLVVHEGQKARAGACGENLFLGDTKLLKGIQRQINPPLAGVFAHIPQDICELQGVAELDGIALAFGGAAAEDFNGNKTNGAGDAPTVFF